MGGFGALFGLGGCLFSGWLAVQQDYVAAGCVFVISLALFGAERLLRDD